MATFAPFFAHDGVDVGNFTPPLYRGGHLSLLAFLIRAWPGATLLSVGFRPIPMEQRLPIASDLVRGSAIARGLEHPSIINGLPSSLLASRPIPN